MYTAALPSQEHHRLLSEDAHPGTDALWGTFPPAIFMAETIAAMRLFRSRKDRTWRASS